MHLWYSTCVPHRNKQGTCILTPQPKSHQGVPCSDYAKGTTNKRSMTRMILRILRMVARLMIALLVVVHQQLFAV